MLIQSVQELIGNAGHLVTALRSRFNLIQIASVACTFSYCSWRLWRFTICPFLKSSEPSVYPYLIPGLGHGVAFFRNSNDLIERALVYFKYNYEPFALQVGPERIYVIIDPQDVAEVYRRSDDFDWASHLNIILTNFGCTDDFIKLGRTPGGQGTVPLLPRSLTTAQRLPLISFIEKTYYKQLMPGPHMKQMSQAFIRSLRTSTDPSNTACFGLFTAKVPSGRRVVSLKKLCEYALLHAGIDSFFGDQLREIDPGLVEKMVTFNHHSWMLFYGLPSYFAEAVKSPQRSLMETFKTFVELPEEQRQGQSWGVQQILIAKENAGVDLQSRAAILLMILWASNSNIHAIAFWTLAHVLVDEKLRESVRKETSKAWLSGSLDVSILTSQCPILAGVFLECLRTKGGAMTGRIVRRPTSLGGKKLLQGATVLIPSQQLHSNANVWGPSSRDFDPERFARDEGLAKHSSYRPFGGGVSMCPGRQIAKEEVYSLVAIMLRRFDVQVSKELPYQFPLLDHNQPALGITGPAPGMDIWLDVNDSLCTA